MLTPLHFLPLLPPFPFPPPQEARRNLDTWTSKANSASDDAAKAEAEIGAEVFGAMVKAVEA